MSNNLKRTSSSPIVKSEVKKFKFEDGIKDGTVEIMLTKEFLKATTIYRDGKRQVVSRTTNVNESQTKYRFSAAINEAIQALYGVTLKLSCPFRLPKKRGFLLYKGQFDCLFGPCRSRTRLFAGYFINPHFQVGLDRNVEFYIERRQCDHSDYDNEDLDDDDRYASLLHKQWKEFAGDQTMYVFRMEENGPVFGVKNQIFEFDRVELKEQAKNQINLQKMKPEKIKLKSMKPLHTPGLEFDLQFDDFENVNKENIFSSTPITKKAEQTPKNTEIPLKYDVKNENQKMTHSSTLIGHGPVQRPKNSDFPSNFHCPALTYDDDFAKDIPPKLHNKLNRNEQNKLLTLAKGNSQDKLCGNIYRREFFNLAVHENTKLISEQGYIDDEAVNILGEKFCKELKVNFIPSFHHHLSENISIDENLAQKSCVSPSFFPVCEGRHWRLFKIHPYPNIDDNELAIDVDVYDSIDQENFRNLKDVISFMKRAIAIWKPNSTFKLIVRDKTIKCPQQQNSRDCGVFVLANLYTQAKKITFKAENISYFRHFFALKLLDMLLHKDKEQVIAWLNKQTPESQTDPNIQTLHYSPEEQEKEKVNEERQKSLLDKQTPESQTESAVNQLQRVKVAFDVELKKVEESIVGISTLSENQPENISTSQEIKQLREENCELQVQLRTAEEDYKKLNSTYNQVKMLSQQTESVLMNAQNQLEFTKCELSERDAQICCITKSNECLKEQIERLTVEITKLKTLKSTAEREKEFFQMSLDRKSEKLQTVESKVGPMSQLKDSNRVMKVQIDDLNCEIKRLESIGCDTRSENQCLCKQLETTKHHLTNAIHENGRMADDLVTITAELNATKKCLNDSQRESENIRGKLQSYIHEIERIDGLIAIKDNERKQALLQHKDLECENIKLMEKFQSLDQETSESKRIICDYEQRITMLSDQLNAREIDIETLEKQVIDLSTEIEMLRSANSKLHVDLEAQRNLCDKLDIQKEKQEAELCEYQLSVRELLEKNDKLREAIIQRCNKHSNK